MKHLESYIRSVRPQFEDMLGHAVEIPSVSSDPARRKDMARMATVAAQYGRSLGARVRTVTTKGYPVVSGGWQVGKQYPTLTIYNHLDVQTRPGTRVEARPVRFSQTGGHLSRPGHHR